MLTRRKAASIIKQIEKHEKAVAKTRDDLDDFIGKLEEMRSDCEEAIDDLLRARDALSKFV